MKQEQIVVGDRRSSQAELGGLIVSAVETFFDRARLVVGRPGLPNIETTLGVGGAVLFETPDEGLFEVRVLATESSKVHLLVSQVAQCPGIAGGLVEQDISNSAFSPAEVERIGSSLRLIQDSMNRRSDVTTEQLDYIARKLDELEHSAQRFGRKDWLNLAIGTLTSIAATTAMDTAARKALFSSAGAALSWLIGSALKLLQ